MIKALRAGRVNYSAIGQTYLAQMGEPAARSSRRRTSAWRRAGRRAGSPASPSHGLGIPAGAKNKEPPGRSSSGRCRKEIIAAPWSEEDLGSPTRRSDYRSSRHTRAAWSSTATTSRSIFLESIDIVGQGGYMKYRTVHVYPQVDPQINKAIS